MKINTLECIAGCIDMCRAAWDLGWHEYHAGNITYRLTDEERSVLCAQADESRGWQTLTTPVPSLAHDYFLVTASGSSFRILGTAPEKYLGIIEVNDAGDAYRTIWGLEGGKPTSELPAHLMNQAVKKQMDGDKYRIIYHAHPANLIALSFVLPLKDEVFTRELWEMEPECAMVFPKGMGVLPWLTPASVESAVKTGEKMKRYDIVLWAYHGAFCAGGTFEDTFGLMYTVEKASEILIKVLSVGGKRQYPSRENFIDLKEPFQLDLPDEFLFHK